ncbi:hypothetical protein FLP10_10085 [Agromyces intestinalis]|uniref:Uncharacterized protein n=1 Tax=Agromyces intestinalis TaxID=2592652 RepID=A0A5C1YGH8_9MICO|nr:hypothetical protein [Agromyces intestinalis]QEO14718.1 hypothetical protein FLP10_10085 [Agromyces intestinalis]
MAGRSRGKRLAGVAVAAAAVVALLTGAAWVGSQAIDLANARGELDASRQALDLAIDRLDASLDDARTADADGRAALDESSGRTLDEVARDALSTALAELDTVSADAEQTLAEASALLAGATDLDDSLSPDDVRATAGALGEASDSMTALDADLADATDGARAATAAVRDAVAAHDAWLEQMRAGAYREHVWAAGWTPELDACQGSVDLTAAYGLPAIAEHWSCTGKEFPREAGAFVVLDGVLAGTYRVDGIAAMLDQTTDTVADLPQGHDLLYQTCIDGNSRTMAMVALTRVD